MLQAPQHLKLAPVQMLAGVDLYHGWQLHLTQAAPAKQCPDEVIAHALSVSRM